MSVREPNDPGGPGRAPDIPTLARAARERLSGERLAHVESVAATAREIAERGGWSTRTRNAVERAAWAHDAVKQEGPDAWRERIETAGEVPDPWAIEHAVDLLHAQAAGVWAREAGERDPRVLAAIRHHPTAHPEWGDVGRILYVADFCEPERPFAAEARTAALRERAGAGPAGLAAASRSVLRLRLEWLLDEERPIHPRSWRAWNAWVGEPRP